MFLGEYHTNFTGQGRVVLPKKFRQDVGNKGVILSRGFEGCIWGFSLEDFEKEAQKQLETTVTEQKGRDVRRYLFSAAESIRLDDQGRFIIPNSLLEYAKLKDRVVIIGAGDHFEIWDRKAWISILNKLTRKQRN